MIYNVLYVDMVGDLFHYGHVEYLKECKKMSKILKVGIHNDIDVASYKRSPVLSMIERIKVVEACKYVDEVIADAPLKVSKEFLQLHNIDKVVHANDISQENIDIMFVDIKDDLIFIPYTDGISTTMIIKRIKKRNDLRV